MAISPSDIVFYESTSGLGGAKTGSAITSAQLHNLFDVVTGAESTAGDIEYRCFYVENTNATDTLTTSGIYIQTNTPSTDTNVEIGLDPAGNGGTAVTIANESTSPAGVTFNEPGSGSPLSLGDLAPGEFYAVWVKRTVDSAAGAFNNDSVILRVTGDSPA